jgi:hypothetical protein
MYINHRSLGKQGENILAVEKIFKTDTLESRILFSSLLLQQIAGVYQTGISCRHLHTQTMSRIRIANPQPGSARYTSASRAERYVRRKEAVIIDGILHFLSSMGQRRMQVFIQNIQSERRAIDAYIRCIVWWNGRDLGGMQRLR